MTSGTVLPAPHPPGQVPGVAIGDGYQRQDHQAAPVRVLAHRPYLQHEARHTAQGQYPLAGGADIGVVGGQI